MTTESLYRQVGNLRRAILDSKPDTDSRERAVSQAIRASLAAPDDGLSLREIEELCDYADQNGH